jgi:hypothetical protein
MAGLDKKFRAGGIFPAHRVNGPNTVPVGAANLNVPGGAAISGSNSLDPLPPPPAYKTPPAAAPAPANNSSASAAATDLTIRLLPPGATSPAPSSAFMPLLATAGAVHLSATTPGDIFDPVRSRTDTTTSNLLSPGSFTSTTNSGVSLPYVTGTRATTTATGDDITISIGVSPATAALKDVVSGSPSPDAMPRNQNGAVVSGADDVDFELDLTKLSEGLRHRNTTLATNLTELGAIKAFDQMRARARAKAEAKASLGGVEAAGAKSLPMPIAPDDKSDPTQIALFFTCQKTQIALILERRKDFAGAARAKELGHSERKVANAVAISVALAIAGSTGYFLGNINDLIALLSSLTCNFVPNTHFGIQALLAKTDEFSRPWKRFCFAYTALVGIPTASAAATFAGSPEVGVVAFFAQFTGGASLNYNTLLRRMNMELLRSMAKPFKREREITARDNADLKQIELAENNLDTSNCYALVLRDDAPLEENMRRIRLFVQYVVPQDAGLQQVDSWVLNAMDKTLRFAGWTFSNVSAFFRWQPIHRATDLLAVLVGFGLMYTAFGYQCGTANTFAKFVAKIASWCGASIQVPQAISFIFGFACMLPQYLLDFVFGVCSVDGLFDFIRDPAMPLGWRLHGMAWLISKGFVWIVSMDSGHNAMVLLRDECAKIAFLPEGIQSPLSLALAFWGTNISNAVVFSASYDAFERALTMLSNRTDELVVYQTVDQLQQLRAMVKQTHARALKHDGGAQRALTFEGSSSSGATSQPVHATSPHRFLPPPSPRNGSADAKAASAAVSRPLLADDQRSAPQQSSQGWCMWMASGVGNAIAAPFRAMGCCSPRPSR